ncbi:MAG: DUF3006 domain-containing protein [Gemmatimonadetes bacterium]|nr:DUF3006 domain-containing protein [Gemmatimonadota bacterium]
MSSTVRRWTVDAIEEGIAAVHQDDGRLVHLPGWILPPGTREGDVLAVEHGFAQGASTLRITLDRAATDDAIRRSREQLQRRLPHDPGGDIVL